MSDEPQDELQTGTRVYWKPVQNNGNPENKQYVKTYQTNVKQRLKKMQRDKNKYVISERYYCQLINFL